MPRLFVALPIPEELREELAGLAGGIQGARWVPPENYHLTLRFIGEIVGWQARCSWAGSTCSKRPGASPRCM